MDDAAKLGNIVELLLAAGYFRARLQAIPPFDKVIGGLAWCIMASRMDLDSTVDMSQFRGILNIKQKM
jgi:hypothetical protein